MQYLQLASLLELAAATLREADSALKKADVKLRQLQYVGVDDNTPIESLPGYSLLKVRSKKALEAQGDFPAIKTVGDICSTNYNDMYKRHGCGLTTVHELQAFLESNGLSFKCDY